MEGDGSVQLSAVCNSSELYIRGLSPRLVFKIHWSLPVTRMNKCAHCSRPTEKLKCAKCRSVVVWLKVNSANTEAKS